MEALEYLYLRLRLMFRKKPKGNNALVTVQIKVRMCCEGCERKAKESVEGMTGVTSAETDRKFSRLTVVGYVDPMKVLKRVKKKTEKKAEMWPFMPYTLVPHPYAPGVYDRDAPPGCVLKETNPESNSLARANSTEQRLLNAFSDNNPDACTIM